MKKRTNKPKWKMRKVHVCHIKLCEHFIEGIEALALATIQRTIYGWDSKKDISYIKKLKAIMAKILIKKLKDEK